MSISLADAETIVAVSATFHTAPDYEEFYKKHGDTLSGFPGIWGLCAKMGIALAEAERSIMPDWDGQWIDAIDGFVAAVYAKSSNMEEVSFSDAELLQMAKDSINQVIKGEK